MTLGQRVAVMRDGRILQVDTPQRLYHQPLDVFVAGFIGSPSMNLVAAEIEADEVIVGELRIPLAADRRPSASGSGNVVLGMRPEVFEDGAFAAPDLPTIDVEVAVLEELGSDAHVFFRVEAPRVSTDEVDDDVEAASSLGADRGSLLNARIDPRSRARVGETIRLAVDPRRFHFFDAQSGATLLPDARLEPVPAAIPG